ncbi:cytochrome P450 72A225-like [Salvia hispanica]|uniref:cytochrome P450 72A225-like n=1 Tax=Salvia hispanica TaxID=49212 RepID=UPI0020090589|nr:cytochrome P450 72A225-like [Salvia hispanica]XP_047950300.1 cytochrome P450 72A225-like [Salvia hispanica]
MEVLYSIVVLFSAVFISYNAWKFLKRAWFEPRKVEQRLRQQGFSGNSYRFMVGDSKEMAAMTKEALSKPIPFSNDIAPRVIPFIHHSLVKYGENCFMWFGSNPAIVISDHQMIKEIMSKNYVFLKTSSPLEKLLTRGLATYEADKWAKHRRLLNPAFHLEKLKLMLPSMYLSCGDMLSKLDKMVPSDGGCEVDVWTHLQALTSDVISRTAFGSSYEEGRKIFELQKEQGTLLLKAAQMLYFPGWRFLPTKTNRRMAQIAKEVDSLILGIINKRKQLAEAGEITESTDLLGLMLESNFNENGEKIEMSLRDLIDECKLFYIAGQESTASLLTWTMILLSKHPDWQARARDEVMQVLGTNEPDFHELNRLQIVTMIFHEVLRLYPGAVLLSRTIRDETRLGDLALPAGVSIFLATLPLQHDCEIWGEDANEFNPERFGEGVSKATKGRLVYFPFGGGPRICIGQNFALLEAKMALALILKRYWFELSPSYAHAPNMVLSLHPQHGAPLILHRIL